MTTFTTEDRIDAEKTVAIITINANGNDVDVTTKGEGQALFIANLIVSMMDNEIKSRK